MADSGLKEAIEGLDKLKFAMVLMIVLAVFLVVAFIDLYSSQSLPGPPSPLLWHFFLWRLLPTPSGSWRGPTACFTRPST